MLLYEKGQFFQRHQDSEKSDDMIGTLVVTLPSKFTGGASVIEHHGERLTTRGSANALQIVAFYADCRHEVQRGSTARSISLWRTSTRRGIVSLSMTPGGEGDGGMQVTATSWTAMVAFRSNLGAFEGRV